MPAPRFTVIFGGFGDLSARYLVPSLAKLNAGVFAGSPVRVFLASRRDTPPEKLAEFLGKSLGADHPRAGDFTTVKADPSDAGSFVALRERLSAEGLLGGEGVFYLSVGPDAFAPISMGLSGAGLTDAPYRLLVEKPFGTDLPSARALADALGAGWGSRALLVDHYLAKPVFRALADWRESEPRLSAAWKSGTVRAVRAVARETVGVEGRAAYYDDSGAFRDMVQNHLLNVAADCVGAGGAAERSAAVESVEFDVAHALFGQYAAGNGQPGYREEPNVAPGSVTETFVRSQVTFRLEAGNVTATLETGKRLASKETFVEVDLADGSTVRAQAAPKPELTWRHADGTVENGPVTGADRNAYEVVFEEAFSPEPAVFCDLPATLAAWEAVDRIVRCVDESCPLVHPYPAGSNGPAMGGTPLGRSVGKK